MSDCYLSTKSFELHQGGKRVSPQELTKVSDWGANAETA
ncbi:addiction module toxin RelE [Citrobacter pasteurii]|uniref:Addiction module toxin RelE n=1 Tax=Citrobacter pasteurii TaxID=1563222 RepID=A0A6N6K8M8_9ENTR|nr:addiction module toxin RelE [Citrobacter pasteurii]